MTYREFIDSREAFTADELEAHNASQDIVTDDGPTDEDYDEMCDYFESLDMDELDDEELYDDDGQPDEYTEWQDLYGGDDWDHGQYDEY